MQDVLRRCRARLVYLSLKEGEYRESRETDEWGTRTFYYYTREALEELMQDAYETIYVHRQQMRKTAWLTLALRAKRC